MMCILAYVQMNVIGIIVLLFFWQNQHRSGSLSLDERLFNGMLFAAIIELLMDSGQWALEGTHFTGSLILQIFCYSAGYAVAPAITCLWAMYCDLRANMDERGLRRRLPLYLLPIFINTGLLVANLFTPLVFRIDSAHLYHRDRFFIVYMVLMYLYGVYSLRLVIHKTLQSDFSIERTEFRYMAVFIIPPLIGGALQWMYYGISLIWISMVLSIIMMYTNVLSRQISTDPLTGLSNRRKLSRYLDMKINSAEADPSMFLVMLDADNFKTINDSYGHTAGDRALVAISEILKQLCLNRNFVLARLGGDEFVILGRDQEDMSPETLIRQIDEHVKAYNAATTEPFRLSLSAGWARFNPQQLNTTDALLNAADERMYEVKAEKKQLRA